MCGAQVGYTPYQKPGMGLAICALIFSFIFPLVGLILGIVGLKKYQTEGKGMCIASVIISGVLLFISIVSTAIFVPALNGYIRRAREAGNKRQETGAVVIVEDAPSYSEYIEFFGDQTTDI